MMSRPELDLVLFDLGGVLVELGESPFPPEWLGSDSRFRLAEWSTSATARSFESGETSAVQFASTLKDELGLSASEAEIIEQFTGWPVGVFPLARQLLARLQETYPLAVLTNSNELHWPRVLGEFDLQRFFKRMYSSHLIHSVKPDRRTFALVLDDLGVPASGVVFFDDNPANVAAAQEVGLVGVQVRGPEELESYLVRNRMIETP